MLPVIFCRAADRHCNIRRNICSYFIAGDGTAIHIKHISTGNPIHTIPISGDGAAIHGECSSVSARVSIELHTIRLLIG